MELDLDLDFLYIYGFQFFLIQIIITLIYIRGRERPRKNWEIKEFEKKYGYIKGRERPRKNWKKNLKRNIEYLKLMEDSANNASKVRFLWNPMILIYLASQGIPSSLENANKNVNLHPFYIFRR